MMYTTLGPHNIWNGHIDNIHCPKQPVVYITIWETTLLIRLLSPVSIIHVHSSYMTSELISAESQNHSVMVHHVHTKLSGMPDKPAYSLLMRANKLDTANCWLFWPYHDNVYTWELPKDEPLGTTACTSDSCGTEEVGGCCVPSPMFSLSVIRWQSEFITSSSAFSLSISCMYIYTHAQSLHLHTHVQSTLFLSP